MLVADRPGGADARTIRVPFEVTLLCRASYAIQENEVYFHFAHMPGSQGATMTGAISADTRVWLTLTASDGRLDQLSQLQSVPSIYVKGRRHALEMKTPVIPVVWQLNENPFGVSRSADREDADGSAASWLLQGTPGDVSYSLHLAVLPDAAQSPGDYGMNVVMTLQPNL